MPDIVEEILQVIEAIKGSPIASLNIELSDDNEIGYFVLKEFRGKGVATKSVKRMLTFGFKKLKLKRITAVTAFGNKASQRILKKFGFRIIKTDKKEKESDNTILILGIVLGSFFLILLFLFVLIVWFISQQSKKLGLILEQFKK